jgi:hypothetical protein
MAALASDPPSSEPQFYEAAHAVLYTNELLCELIGYLPLEDIVIATGVCKTWRSAHASVAIQQALFLAPRDVRWITTITEYLPTCVEDIPRKNYAVIGELNTSLARIFSREVFYDSYRSGSRPGHSGTTCTSPRESSGHHPFGLWRDMFVTQPPTTHLRFCLYSSEQFWLKMESTQDYFGMDCEGIYPFECDEGIRMGQLHDLIESKVQAHQGKKVAVRLIMSGFHPLYQPYSDYLDQCWEVRKGEAVRVILPLDDWAPVDDEPWDTDSLSFTSTLFVGGTLIL